LGKGRVDAQTFYQIFLNYLFFFGERLKYPFIGHVSIISKLKNSTTELKRRYCNFRFSGITKIAKKAKAMTKFFLMLFLKARKIFKYWSET